MCSVFSVNSIKSFGNKKNNLGQSTIKVGHFLFKYPMVCIHCSYGYETPSSEPFQYVGWEVTEVDLQEEEDDSQALEEVMKEEEEEEDPATRESQVIHLQEEILRCS
jgi:hypothetical protein